MCRYEDIYIFIINLSLLNYFSGDGYCRSEAIMAIFLQKTADCRRIYATVVHCKANCDGYKEQGMRGCHIVLVSASDVESLSLFRCQFPLTGSCVNILSGSCCSARQRMSGMIGFESTISGSKHDGQKRQSWWTKEAWITYMSLCYYMIREQNSRVKNDCLVPSRMTAWFYQIWLLGSIKDDCLVPSRMVLFGSSRKVSPGARTWYIYLQPAGGWSGYNLHIVAFSGGEIERSWVHPKCQDVGF